MSLQLEGWILFLQFHEATYGLIIVNLMSHSQWIYTPSDDGVARFSLGTEGQNPLICFGINPSTAVPGKLDPTVARVRNIAARNKFDSWLMLNVYPQISTDPKGIHHVFEPALKNGNERQIEQLLSGRSLIILAASGGLIDSRSYFHSLLADVVKVTDAAGCRWVSLGNPLVNGHPRHPSRARNELQLESFDMQAYLHGKPGGVRTALPLLLTAVWRRRTVFPFIGRIPEFGCPVPFPRRR